MNIFIRSVLQILKGSGKAFQTSPAAIINALAFAIVAMIRIQLDWPQQEAYNFLFNCLHWAFALGAVFSLAVITAAQSRSNQARAVLIANFLGIIAAGVTFLLLYMFGGTNPILAESRYPVLSGLAISRVAVGILVSLAAFIYLAGYPKDRSDFARSFFMTQKAFFIALIYGLVIEGGTSGVAGAIQALLYRDMSEKVYMYLATISGFLAFTIFVGYFPDFRKGKVDEKREVAQKQPRFIEILLEYIVIPIVLALTVVLLIWAGKTVISGLGSSFIRLSEIAAAYTVGGIWLHILVTHYETGLAKWYRRIYPVAALIILAFEAWAFLNELQKTSLTMIIYSFIVIWIIALGSAVLLLIIKDKAHPAIVALSCLMAVFSVLPVVGYQALPVTAQVSRLENLLVSQGMLVGGQLIPAATVPEEAVRVSITDAVSHLTSAEDAKLPVWFDKHLGEYETFKAKLGFEQTWPQAEGPYENGPVSKGISLVLPPEAIDISGYRWAFDLQNYAETEKGNAIITLNGNKGLYRINWNMNMREGIPTLKIELDGRVILEQSMNIYIDRIKAGFPPGETAQPTLKDMSQQLETPEISVLLVFRNININLDPNGYNYYLNLSALYLQEKP
ncbi:MAG TPA: DUF4153 domain-containing protein [Desulfitobacteriaceae bacterium]|nr:DUF4153 domain-containing protein [Desulfitobacteriaceae bacterium]